MIRSLFLALALCAGLHATSPAQPLDPFIPLPEDLEVELALSALPPHLRDDATVYVLDRSTGFVVHREGTNGFHTLVVRTDHAAFRGDWAFEAYPADLLAPISFDPAGARSILPAMLDVHALQASGMAPGDLKRTISERFEQGHYGPPPRTGMSYMLSPILRAYPDPASSAFIGTFSYPHYMIYAPGVTGDDIGAHVSGVHGSVTEPGVHGFIILPAGAQEAADIRREYAPMLERLCSLNDAWCLAEPKDFPWPTDGWTRADPAAVGLDPGPLARLDADILDGRFGQVDRMLVVRSGLLAFDRRYGQDYFAVSRGIASPIGCGWMACEGDPERIEDPFNYIHPSSHPYWHGTELHSVQSVTKSIAATVLGAAIHRGAIEGVHAPLLPFFGDHDLSGVDSRLHVATLADLLTMRSGIEWHETDRPLDETNTTIALERSDDWIQFTLDQPMDADPGAKWAYNSGGSHLMSGVVRMATGRFIDDYAREFVFDPLGIRSHHWKKTPQGYPDTEGGFYIEASDLAKIGLLYLHDGMWDGRRILPEGWAREATTDHVGPVPGASGYGYQWWRIDRGDTEIWAAQGFGQNYLLILPQADVVAVIQAWNLFGNARASIRNALIGAVLEALEGA